MIPAVPGYCPSCGDKIIERRKDVGWVTAVDVRLPNYAEIMVELLNGSKMVVAVCLKCRSNGIDDHLDELYEACCKGWKIELDHAVACRAMKLEEAEKHCMHNYLGGIRRRIE